MPYYDVANLVTVAKTNMIKEMSCGYGTVTTTGVGIPNQVSRRPVQRSSQLQYLTIPIVKSHSILNATPLLQVLSGARENLLAQSESSLPSSRGSWEHLQVLRSSGEEYRSVWPVCVWLPDQITFCWWSTARMAPPSTIWSSTQSTIQRFRMMLPYTRVPRLNTIPTLPWWSRMISWCRTISVFVTVTILAARDITAWIRTTLPGTMTVLAEEEWYTV